MVSEQICLDILRSLHGRRTRVKQTLHPGDPSRAQTSESVQEHSQREDSLIPPLLVKYALSDVDAAIRWLELCGFLMRVEWGMRGPWAHALSESGIAAAEVGFSDEQRKHFGPEEPHQVFLARQFRDADAELAAPLREALEAGGYEVVEGRVSGLEEFRHAILSKIETSRFFVCLLTHRSQLESGGHASSVWLYQEVGAAIAFGKSPLLLVEEGMDDHYAGELESTYEFIPFSREVGLAQVVDEVVRRLDVDLQSHDVPLPTRDQAAAE